MTFYHQKTYLAYIYSILEILFLTRLNLRRPNDQGFTSPLCQIWHKRCKWGQITQKTRRKFLAVPKMVIWINDSRIFFESVLKVKTIEAKAKT